MIEPKRLGVLDVPRKFDGHSGASEEYPFLKSYVSHFLTVARARCFRYSVRFLPSTMQAKNSRRKLAVRR
jgi:hypothetical protein